ncbi:MAG: hypothetical protein QOF55_1010, partial [Thermoleophilaceae bacterium]|nr:hypothetical protein [Thermoleophilaceae bacterium]
PVAPVAPITPVTPITPPVVVDPPFPPPAGSAGPAVKIVSPAPGAHVRRRAVVRTVVSDSAAVVRTEVWVDGRLRRSLAASHVAWHWSLRHARRGRHLIVVRAFDAAGKHGSASVRVRVTR